MHCVLCTTSSGAANPVSALENVAVLSCSKFITIQLLHLEHVLGCKYLFFLLLLIHSTPFQLIKQLGYSHSLVLNVHFIKSQVGLGWNGP